MNKTQPKQEKLSILTLKCFFLNEVRSSTVRQFGTKIASLTNLHVKFYALA